MRHLICFALLVLCTTPALANSADAGAAKSIECVGCHGANGISRNDIWPNIAGQKATYLKQALREYRDGTRYNPIMASVARLLSDDDIDDLAAYYSRLPVSPAP